MQPAIVCDCSVNLAIVRFINDLRISSSPYNLQGVLYALLVFLNHAVPKGWLYIPSVTSVTFNRLLHGMNQFQSSESVMPIYNPNQYLSETFYKGLHVYSDRGPLVTPCLEYSYRLIESLLNEWPNLYAFRFDLHFPQNTYDWNTVVISKFMASLEAKLKAYMSRMGLPVECGKFRYSWTRERNDSENYHYHVMVFLNGDVINSSGYLFGEDWSLKKAVIEAWASALGLDYELVKGLPHFPDNCDYTVNSRSLDFLQQLANLFYRLSYFAKEDTKEPDNGARSFTCSHVFNPFLSISLANLLDWHKEVLGIGRDALLVSNEVW